MPGFSYRSSQTGAHKTLLLLMCAEVIGEIRMYLILETHKAKQSQLFSLQNPQAFSTPVSSCLRMVNRRRCERREIGYIISHSYEEPLKQYLKEQILENDELCPMWS